MLAVDSRARPVSRSPGRGPLTVIRPSPFTPAPTPLSTASSRLPRSRPRTTVAVAVPVTLARPGLRPLSPSTYRRRRALVAGAVVAVTALATVVLGALGGGSLTAPERPLPVDAGRVYVVQPGDTFWSIAREVEPEGDVRPVVDRLVAEHGGATLVVGEPIRVPLRA